MKHIINILMKQELKQPLHFYDTYSKVYADYTFPKLMQFQLNDFISRLPKKAKVLDIGCGSGRDAHYFNDYGLDVTAIDLSENMLKEAKSRVPDVKFKKMDMTNTKFKDNHFDGIWIMATLTSVSKKDALATLKEAARVLKHDGVLYLAVKEGSGEFTKEKPEYDNYPKFYSHYSQLEMESLLSESGFTLLRSTVEEDTGHKLGQKWVEIYAKLSS